MSTIGHIEDLAVPYALGMLDAATAQQVEAHIADCAMCAQSLAEAARTTSFLPFLATPSTPRPEVKQHLMARIAEAEAHRLAPAKRDVRVLPLPAPERLLPPAVPMASAGRWQSVRRRLRAPFHLERTATGQPIRPAYAATLVAVPFVLALTFVGMWAMSLHGQLTEAKGQVSVLHTRVDTMRDLVADSSHSVYEYQLTGGPAAPKASGTIYANPDQSSATLMVWNMNASSAPESYQILLEKNGQLTPVGQLTVDSSGMGTASFPFSGSLTQYRSVHIKAVPTTTTGAALLSASNVSDALSTEIDARVGSMMDAAAP